MVPGRKRCTTEGRWMTTGFVTSVTRVGLTTRLAKAIAPPGATS